MKTENDLSLPFSRGILLVGILSILLHIIFILTGCHGIYLYYPINFALLFGIPIISYDLLRKALKFEFSSDILAGIAIITSLFLDEKLAGVVVFIMLSGGNALEDFALKRAAYLK